MRRAAPDSARTHAGSPRLFSIIVLTYNRKALLREGLESLAALDDPGIPIEIIVADDGSTDGTGDVVRELQARYPQIRYCPLEHGGIAAARNHGIRHAAGDFVAIVADDYLFPPDYARAVVTFFAKYPDAQIVRFRLVAAEQTFLSRACHIYHEASLKRRLADGWEFSGFRRMWRRLHEPEDVTTEHGLEAAGGSAYRREVFDRVGLFDESFQRAEDSDFTMRLRAAGIPVHYNPHHEVRVRYESSLRAVLRTAHKSGRYRWRYYARHTDGGVNVPGLLRTGVAMKLSVLYWATWRAWRAGSFVDFVRYLPVMVLIEGANKAGFAAEARAARKAAE